jgi:hypothetical protein
LHESYGKFALRMFIYKISGCRISIPWLTCVQGELMQRAVVVRGGELRAGAGAGRTPEGKTGRAARPSVNSAPPPVPRHPPGSGLHRLRVRLTSWQRESQDCLLRTFG